MIGFQTHIFLNLDLVAASLPGMARSFCPEIVLVVVTVTALIVLREPDSVAILSRRVIESAPLVDVSLCFFREALLQEPAILPAVHGP